MLSFIQQLGINFALMMLIIWLFAAMFAVYEIGYQNAYINRHWKGILCLLFILGMMGVGTESVWR